MRTQRYLRLAYWGRHLFLSLRSLRWMALVPFFFLYLLCPLIVVLDIKRTGIGEELMQDIITYHQYFIPLFSVWWMLLIFRNYVEQEGNELYYLYNGKGKLLECLSLSGVFLLFVLLPYLLYTTWFPSLWLDFLRLCMECIFFAGLAYFLLFLTKSLALTLLPLLLYTLLCVALEQGSDPFFLIYLSLSPATWQALLRHDLPMLLTGSLLLALGWGINRYACRYH